MGSTQSTWGVPVCGVECILHSVQPLNNEYTDCTQYQAQCLSPRSSLVPSLTHVATPQLRSTFTPLRVFSVQLFHLEHLLVSMKLLKCVMVIRNFIMENLFLMQSKMLMMSLHLN